MENRLEELLSEMDNKLKEMQRNITTLNEYNDEIEGYSNKDYLGYKANIRETIETVTNIPEEIKRLADEIDGLDLNTTTGNNKKEKKNLILKKLDTYEEDARPLIESVQNKERRFADITEDDAREIQRDNSIGGQMKLVKIERNAEVLEVRRKELEQIKEASAQVNQLSEVMKKEVYDQDQMFNDIEANVDKVNENVVKADNKIKEAKEIQKDTGKRAKCMAIIAIAVVIAIIAVVCYNSFQSTVKRYEDDFQLIKLFLN